VAQAVWKIQAACRALPDLRDSLEEGVVFVGVDAVEPLLRAVSDFAARVPEQRAPAR
jgi:hypothetical protein